MNKIKLAGGLAVLVLGMTAILQNTQIVETRFLFFKASLPNSILLGLALLAGMAIGIFTAALVISRKHNAKKKQQ